MARPKIVPRDHERRFDFHELFFSTTDQKGIILSGNEVFSRVAGYDSVDELIGQPHNIIRHPDMPRAVFKLLWDTLKAGEPFAGYVKNLATDGGYYWVMALVVPVEGGYLSVRFKPTSPYFAVIKEVYADLLNVERDTRDSTESWRVGMERAEARLGVLLAQKGFVNYAEFMRTALATELASRRQKLGAGSRSEVHYQEAGSAREIAATLRVCENIEKHLDDLFANASSFLELIQHLDTKSSFLRDLAHKFHFVSLNGVVSSEHLGQAGAALSVVTQNLSAIAKESKDVIAQMTDQRAVTSPLRATAFAITSAKLQVEMAIFFARELLQNIGNDAIDETIAARVRRDLDTLVRSFAQSTARMLETLPAAQSSIALRVEMNAKLTAILQSLAVTRVSGKVQAVHVPGAEYFQEFFEEIHEQLRAAKREMLELENGIPFLQAHLPHFKQAGGLVQQSLSSFA